MFAVALLVAIVPPLAFDGAWMDWIYKALVLLVICPCPLVISTPVTIVSGLAAAARKGILVKGGVYLEEGANLPRSRSTRPARSRRQTRPDGLHGAERRREQGQYPGRKSRRTFGSSGLAGDRPWCG